MSIAKNFLVVKQALDAYLQAHGQPPVSHELGENHMSDASTFPRIVWCVRGGKIVPNEQGGPDSRKAIRRRKLNIDVHVWGTKGDTDVDTFEACEALMQHFNAAARVALTGFSWRAIEEDWTVGQAQTAAAGQLVILRIELDLPLTFEPLIVVKNVTPVVTAQYPHS